MGCMNYGETKLPDHPANFIEWYTRSTYIDSLVQTFLCVLDQVSAFWIHIAHHKCCRSIAMVTIQVYLNTNCQGTLSQPIALVNNPYRYINVDNITIS